MVDYNSEFMLDRGHRCKKSSEGMGKEFVAGEDIAQGTFVKFAGTDDITVVTCGAGERLIGVAMHDADSGDQISVQQDGYHWIVVGTASGLAVGDWVMSDANGKAVEYGCDAFGVDDATVGGIILSTPTEDDDCVCMKIQLVPICITRQPA